MAILLRRINQLGPRLLRPSLPSPYSSSHPITLTAETTTTSRLQSWLRLPSSWPTRSYGEVPSSKQPMEPAVEQAGSGQKQEPSAGQGPMRPFSDFLKVMPKQKPASTPVESPPELSEGQGQGQAGRDGLKGMIGKARNGIRMALVLLASNHITFKQVSFLVTRGWLLATALLGFYKTIEEFSGIGDVLKKMENKTQEDVKPRELPHDEEKQKVKKSKPNPWFLFYSLLSVLVIVVPIFILCLRIWWKCV